MEDKKKIRSFIEGAGGGGKSGGDAPTEDPDTLRSKAKAQVLAALCEGPITGFPAGFTDAQRKQRVFLNDTALIGEDGLKNFEDVEIVFANGTQAQQALPGFNDVRVEQTVGTKVTKDIGKVSATTTSSQLNRLYVRMGVASLFRVEDDGDVTGTQVKFNIELTTSDGQTIASRQETIKGKSRGPYDVEYEFALSGNGRGR